MHSDSMIALRCDSRSIFVSETLFYKFFSGINSKNEI